MVAAIDIHKSVFQAATLDPVSGETSDERFAAERERLEDWAMRHKQSVKVVAVEATTGWRWVARELQRHGFEVRLVDPGQASALQGRRRRAKTDRLDARWLALLLARELEPRAWLAPEEIQQLRDQTRLRRALVDERRRWAQRLHALLCQEGWPCGRARLLTAEGRRWCRALTLPAPSRAYAETALALIEALEAQLAPIEAELHRFARRDPRCQALTTIYGVGPILACHLLAEIGDARRFSRPRQLVRAAGLDPVVSESGETRRRGRLSKAGSPHLRWALVQAAQHAHRRRSPDLDRYRRGSRRLGRNRAKPIVARTIAARAWHLMQSATPA